MKQVVASGFRILEVSTLSALRMGCRGEVAREVVVVVETAAEDKGAAHRAVGEGGWVVPAARVSTEEEEEKLGISMTVVDGRGGGALLEPGKRWRRGARTGSRVEAHVRGGRGRGRRWG